MDKNFMRYSVKMQARQVLRADLIKCMAAGAVYLCAQLALSFLQEGLARRFEAEISALGPYAGLLFTGAALLSLFITLPILLGVYQFFIMKHQGKAAGLGDVFSWMGDARKFFKAYGLGGLVFAVAIFWFLLIVGAADYVVEWLLWDTISQNTGLAFLSMAGIFALGVVAMAKILTYFPAFFLFAEDPDRKFLFCIRESSRLMKPHKWDFFLLLLSFIGWILLGILTMGILMIYVFPYQALSMIGYFDRIRQEDGGRGAGAHPDIPAV